MGTSTPQSGPPEGLTAHTRAAKETVGAPPTVDEVMAVLENVIDPELGADIVSLGMVPSVEVAEDGWVTVEIKLTISGCPMRAEIKKEVETRVELHPGVARTKIVWGEMNAEERSEVMTKARWNARENAADTMVPESCNVVAIASGKGGVGKSSVTVNIGAALAHAGHTVGILDADIWGFSVPRLLGISDRMEAEAVEGSDKPLIMPNERQVGDGLLKVVSTGFLVGEDTALMWRGLMLTSRSGHDIREVMEQKAAIFQGYASSMNAFTSLKFSDHFGYMPRGTNGALRHGILCSAK